MIPDAGENIYEAFDGIVAEGTGTSTINLSIGGDASWHINGLNDTIDMSFSQAEFYFRNTCKSMQRNAVPRDIYA